jgi:hypothetical protein
MGFYMDRGEKSSPRALSRRKGDDLRWRKIRKKEK